MRRLLLALLIAGAGSTPAAAQTVPQAGRYVLTTDVIGIDAVCRIRLTDTQNRDREGYIYFARIEEISGNLHACSTLGALDVREWSNFGSTDQISLLFLRGLRTEGFGAVAGQPGVYRLEGGFRQEGAPAGDLLLRRVED